MGRRPRATAAAKADRHASELAKKLGASLRDARLRSGATQAAAAARAGLSQASWSELETRADPRYTLATWDRAAHAAGTSLSAYLPQASAADQPRDAVQLKAQELVIRVANPGGWAGMPEMQIDGEARTSRFGDVVLSRPRIQPTEIALMEIYDWFDDVGAPTREWQRRLEGVEKWAIGRMVGDQDVPRVSGCWIVRATQRDRKLVADHANFFHSRFPGSGRAWLAALGDPSKPMPSECALLWISVNGERLFPARLG